MSSPELTVGAHGSARPATQRRHRSKTTRMGTAARADRAPPSVSWEATSRLSKQRETRRVLPASNLLREAQGQTHPGPCRLGKRPKRSMVLISLAETHLHGFDRARFSASAQAYGTAEATAGSGQLLNARPLSAPMSALLRPGAGRLGSRFALRDLLRLCKTPTDRRNRRHPGQPCAHAGQRATLGWMKSVQTFPRSRKDSRCSRRMLQHADRHQHLGRDLDRLRVRLVVWSVGGREQLVGLNLGRAEFPAEPACGRRSSPSAPRASLSRTRPSCCLAEHLLPRRTRLPPRGTCAWLPPRSSAAISADEQIPSSFFSPRSFRPHGDDLWKSKDSVSITADRTLLEETAPCPTFRPAPEAAGNQIATDLGGSLSSRTCRARRRTSLDQPWRQPRSVQPSSGRARRRGSETDHDHWLLRSSADALAADVRVVSAPSPFVSDLDPGLQRSAVQDGHLDVHAFCRDVTGLLAFRLRLKPATARRSVGRPASRGPGSIAPGSPAFLHDDGFDFVCGGRLAVTESTEPSSMNCCWAISFRKRRKAAELMPTASVFSVPSGYGRPGTSGSPDWRGRHRASGRNSRCRPTWCARPGCSPAPFCGSQGYPVPWDQCGIALANHVKHAGAPPHPARRWR